MKLARMPDGSPEIFHTLQGEGRSIGRPSVFIRASLCNLHCRWCDTPYTWNWEDTNFEHNDQQKFLREEQILEYSTEQILTRLSSFPCTNYVFTGGEPLLQERSWTELMVALAEGDPSCHFELETNGTLFPGSDFLDHIDQCNVSPKLANSGVSLESRYKPETLREFAITEKADFKFVIGGSDDTDEVLRIVEECSLPQDQIFLMPKANSGEELDRNQDSVAHLALQHGFHYSDRLHLRLYGAQRGT